MTFHEWLRIAVIVCTAVFAVLVAILIWQWHNDKKNTFDLRHLFMVRGKDGKSYASRVALAELTALAATTSAYLGVMAVKPETFVEATACYGGLWAVRGGFATWIKNVKK